MPTHTHYINNYISLGRPGGGGEFSLPLVCGAGLEAGSTVRGAKTDWRRDQHHHHLYHHLILLFYVLYEFLNRAAFAHHILLKRCQGEAGVGLLRQSSRVCSQYKLDVFIGKNKSIKTHLITMEGGLVSHCCLRVFSEASQSSTRHTAI